MRDGRGSSLLEVPAAHFSGRDFGHYRGVTLPIPLASPDLLARLYGPDWRTPAEVWNGHYAVPAPPLAAVA